MIDLTADELEQLVTLNQDRAAAYRLAADDLATCDSLRQIALALCTWRQGRARHFAEAAAEVERVEAWTAIQLG